VERRRRAMLHVCASSVCVGPKGAECEWRRGERSACRLWRPRYHPCDARRNVGQQLQHVHRHPGSQFTNNLRDYRYEGPACALLGRVGCEVRPCVPYSQITPPADRHSFTFTH